MLFNELESGVFGIANNRDLYTPLEGLLRGTMFSNIYDTYKNMNYLKLTPKNEKETLLMKIYAYDFAINDLNLYLDIYPNDLDKYNYFKECVYESKKLKKEYEQYYGPLDLCDISSLDYTWYKNPWPWEGKVSKYV